MKKITIYLLVAFTLFISGNVFSQSITLDGVSGGVSNDTIFVNQQVQFDIRMNTEGTNYSGITNGFRVFSPDGAEWTTMVGDTMPLNWGSRFDLLFSVDHFSVTGSESDTVGFGGAVIFGPGLDINFNEVAYSIIIGPVDAMDHKKQICLDSSAYLPSGTWKWQLKGAPAEFPSWDGPHCYTVIDPSAPAEPSNIVLSPTFLDYTSIEGGAPPASQTFDVLSDLDPFNFTLNESASWIVISPLQGTSGQTILTNINTVGLSAGTYIDSIEVVAPTTDNSPQWEVITLVVEPPPPAIAVSPMSLFFNAVAGEANPDDKIITISNANFGSSDLNWSVSNSESWMSLTPVSGVNTGDVTVSIDITGLGFDEYSDTIIVTDPLATNDPVKIPITLSVGSDLPLIAVDSSFNYIIVPAGLTTIPARDIVVYNGGAGGMTYSLTEASPRIFTLNPVSGTAPDTVAVGFKITSGVPGDDFIDTLWVHSPEAINSPYPVIFHFHYVNIPAQIVMNDTVVVNVFECDQGAYALDPQGYFNISNVAGGETYMYQVDYESDLFTMEFENNSVPEFVSVVANDLQLPLGTYYDTITVSAINAINSPQSIIVKYNVVPGVTTPAIIVSSNKFVVTRQENEGPIDHIVLEVLNLYGGCMPWTFVEDAPWIIPEKTTGNVTDVVGIIINGDGYTLGTYYDTLEVTASPASNSPRKVAFELKMWKLHGDFDWDGIIDITDLVLMVEYFFVGGAGPQPENRVADINCDNIIDIEDIVLLVEFMFNSGDIPCGNPF